MNRCVEFASRGCIVYATARRIASMESFKHENIRKKALDVTDEEGVRRVTKEIIEEVGKIDIVVSNFSAPLTAHSHPGIC